MASFTERLRARGVSDGSPTFTERISKRIEEDRAIQARREKLAQYWGTGISSLNNETTAPTQTAPFKKGTSLNEQLTVQNALNTINSPALTASDMAEQARRAKTLTNLSQQITTEPIAKVDAPAYQSNLPKNVSNAVNLSAGLIGGLLKKVSPQTSKAVNIAGKLTQPAAEQGIKVGAHGLSAGLEGATRGFQNIVNLSAMGSEGLYGLFGVDTPGLNKEKREEYRKANEKLISDTRRDLGVDRENMSGAGGFIYDTATNIPQMMGGPILFFLSSAGGYAQDAEQKGANLGQSLAHGLIGGGIEATLESKLGAIPGIKNLKDVAKGGIKGFLKTAAGEALEEAITDPLTKLSEKAIFNKNLPWYSKTEDAVINPSQMGMSALGGATMAAMLAPFGLGGNVQQMEQQAPIQAESTVQQSPILQAQQQTAPTLNVLPEPAVKVVMESQKSKPTFKDALKNFYTRIVDTQRPIGEFSKAAGDKTAILASNTRNAGGTVDYIFTDALVDRQGNKIGDSLEKVVGEIPQGKEQAFWDYMLQRHNIDRAREGNHVIPNYTPEMSIQAVQQIESANPEFKAIGDKITGWIDTLMREWGVNSGLIDSNLYNSLREMYKSYIPTQREFTEIEKAMPDGIRQQFADQVSPIRRATGSSRDVNNPIENIMNLVNRTVKTARYNEVGQSLLNSVRNNPALADYAEIISEADGKASNADNVIYVLENGKPVYLRIHNQELLNALKGLPKVINNAKVMRKITNGFKALITQKNPIFAIRNFIKDIPTAYVYGSESNPFIFAKDLLKAQRDILTNSENYQRYRAIGGGMSGFFKGDAEAAAKQLNKQGARDRFVQNLSSRIGGSKLGNATVKTVDTVLHPLRSVEIINNMIETAPRLAEFNRVYEATGDVQQALDASNNVTVNFARGGDITKSAEPYVPYLNAGVQGLDRFFKAFKDPKTAVATLIKAGIAITLPEIAFYLINKDRKEYKELDNRTKDNYFLIPTNDGRFIKIPKSRELGVLFGALFQRILRALEGESIDSAFKGFGTSVGTSFAPANPIENNFFAPIAINIPSNKDFAGRNIVPLSMVMDKRSPYLQYDERTSELAKFIGQFSTNFVKGGTSPKQIDYLIDAYTGIIGDFLIPSTTKGGNPQSVIERQFVADPLYSNKTLTEFYENYDRLQQMATDKNIIENLPTSGKENIVTDEEALRNKFSKASKQISELNKQIRTIEATLDPNKEKEIRKLRQQMIDIASEANQLLEH